MKKGHPDSYSEPQFYTLDSNSGNYEPYNSEELYDPVIHGSSRHDQTRQTGPSQPQHPPTRKYRKPSRRFPKKRGRQSSFLHDTTYSSKFPVFYSNNGVDSMDTPPASPYPSSPRLYEPAIKVKSNTKRRRTMNRPLNVLDIYDGPLYEVDLKRLEICTNLQRLRDLEIDDDEEALVWTDSENDDVDYYELNDV